MLNLERDQRPDELFDLRVQRLISARVQLQPGGHGLDSAHGQRQRVVSAAAVPDLPAGFGSRLERHNMSGEPGRGLVQEGFQGRAAPRSELRGLSDNRVRRRVHLRGQPEAVAAALRDSQNQQSRAGVAG